MVPTDSKGHLQTSPHAEKVSRGRACGSSNIHPADVQLPQVPAKAMASPEARTALRAVLRAWLPLSEAVLGMAIAQLPSPRQVCCQPQLNLNLDLSRNDALTCGANTGFEGGQAKKTSSWLLKYACLYGHHEAAHAYWLERHHVIYCLLVRAS